MLRLGMSGKNGFWVTTVWVVTGRPLPMLGRQARQPAPGVHARRSAGALYHGVRLHQNPQVIVDSQPGSTRKSRVHSRYAARHDRRGNLERYLAKPLGTHLGGQVIHKQDIATLVDK